jgi:hypothetical protein
MFGFLSNLELPDSTVWIPDSKTPDSGFLNPKKVGFRITSQGARQVYPGCVQEFMKTYERAIRRPHGYLMLDLKSATKSDYQHRL